jgi:alkaline phosphatase
MMTYHPRTSRTVRRAFLAGSALSLLTVSAASAQSVGPTQADDSYFKQGQQTLQRMLTQQRNTNRAKNVILFVADGMGFATVTATRILEGQMRGVDGESNVLAYEAFPYLAASKTYSHDGQVSDSAPTAVAMTAGVKTKNDIIGLDQTADLNNCEHQKTKTVTTLFEMAESIGMSTGAVSTARITHATPAAVYGHIANRDWEGDANMPAEALQAGCLDLARQLVEMDEGDGLEVAMGGGRDRFLPATADDPEDQGRKGTRKDGKDLTQAWVARYGNSGAFVWNKEQFDKLDPQNVDHVLGLFERSHMEYEADRSKDAAKEPSLAEMTVKAIDIVAKNPEGYVLMVEGGRVDHSHHAGNAYRALTDGIAFNDAIKAALEKVNLDETLIVVTGDHSHTLTISGYPKRGNPLLDIVRGVDGEVILGMDGKPYTTVSYANGPGGWASAETQAIKDEMAAKAAAAAGTAPPSPPAGAQVAQPGAVAAATEGNTETQAAPVKLEAIHRPDLSKVDTTDVDYIQQATVPLPSETHGGEDLGIYAIGPWAHLFQGTVEQHYIFHVMDFASKISERAKAAGGQPAQKAQ